MDVRQDQLVTSHLPFWSILPATFLLLAISSVANAQDSVGTQVNVPSATNMQSGTASDEGTADVTSSAEGRTAPEIEGRGAEEFSGEQRRFQYHFTLGLRGVYDDNINISQTNRVSDYYYTIEPVLTLGAGDITAREENYIRLDYAPSLLLYVHHASNNAFQQVISLGGQHRFSRLTLSLAEEIAILDGTDVRSIGETTQAGSNVNLDVSARTKFQTFNTRAGASYDLTGKTFLSTEFDSLVTNYDLSALISSQTISENIFINYRYSDKVVLGVGGTAGYDFVDNPTPSPAPSATPSAPPSVTPDQIFEQANARLLYNISGKLNVNLSGGVEFRQFQGHSRGQHIAPVFALTIAYQPSDATTLSLTGGRQTYNSAVLAGQDFTNTIIQGSVRQRFLQRFYIGAAAGYQNSTYFSTISGGSATRQDNYYFVEPSLDFFITRFWTAGGYYLHRQNDSSALFGFRDNQVGLRTGLTF